jgi:hypothetical protein
MRPEVRKGVKEQKKSSPPTGSIFEQIKSIDSILGKMWKALAPSSRDVYRLHSEASHAQYRSLMQDWQHENPGRAIPLARKRTIQPDGAANAVAMAKKPKKSCALCVQRIQRGEWEESGRRAKTQTFDWSDVDDFAVLRRCPDRRSKVDYINERVQSVDGKSVQDAIKTTVPWKAKHRPYHRGDLRYDIESSFLHLEPKAGPSIYTAVLGFHLVLCRTIWCSYLCETTKLLAPPLVLLNTTSGKSRGEG